MGEGALLKEKDLALGLICVLFEMPARPHCGDARGTRKSEEEVRRDVSRSCL